MALPTPASNSMSKIYYFAYGSNMCLEQMAERCPASLLSGKGVMLGYRWQINERGVANIVPSQGGIVQGLLFLVNAQDQKALDKSEGVRSGFYERLFLPLSLRETVGDALKTSYQGRQLAQGRKPPLRPTTRLVRALVYISSYYKCDGRIREEYAGRMERAGADGMDLGISPRYFMQFLKPFVSGPRISASDRDAAQRLQAQQRRERASLPDERMADEQVVEDVEPASEPESHVMRARRRRPTVRRSSMPLDRLSMEAAERRKREQPSKTDARISPAQYQEGHRVQAAKVRSGAPLLKPTAGEGPRTRPPRPVPKPLPRLAKGGSGAPVHDQSVSRTTIYRHTPDGGLQVVAPSAPRRKPVGWSPRPAARVTNGTG